MKYICIFFSSARTIKECLDDEDLKATTEFNEREQDYDSGSSTPVILDQDKDARSEKSYQDCYSQPASRAIIEEVGMVGKLEPVSPIKVHRAYRVKEKETGTEKSPSEEESEYYDLLDNEAEDDIKFADEDDEDEELDKRESKGLMIPQVKSNRSSYYDV